MSVKRKTTNRLTLYRNCGTCGKPIVTTADSPWLRIIESTENGKRRQLTRYYCSTECFQASYRHIGWYDGKAEQRRREKDRNRPPRTEWWKKYYEEHGEEIRQRRKERYWQNIGESSKDGEFYRKKRKLLREAANEN